MKDKKLLIVERCNSNLQIIEEQLEGQDKKSIVLTGLFTTFGTKNRNGRIYESAENTQICDIFDSQIYIIFRLCYNS